MTPEERAEKEAIDQGPTVLQACKASYDEGYLKGLQAHPCCCEASEDCDHEDEGYHKGRASMREEAAKVADSYNIANNQGPLAQAIAREIRAIPMQDK